MANINLTIPDEHLGRVVRALCKGAGLEESPANAKQAVIEHIKRTVANVEESEARQAAQAAVVAVDADGLVA